jgi:anti-sigma28 factor (negative regulator of flagellin synthesis)
VFAVVSGTNLNIYSKPHCLITSIKNNINCRFAGRKKTMNINNINKLVQAYGANKTNKVYKTGHPENNQIRLVPATYDVAKKDFIQISGEAAAGRVIGAEAKKIAAELESGTSAAKINELRAAYQNGSYNVADEDIADAMLSQLFG